MGKDKLYKSLEDYYKHVDKLENINSIMLPIYINNFRENAVKLSENDKKQIELEIYCLNFLVRDGKIKPIYTRENENGNIEDFPNLNFITDTDIKYLKKRLKKISNIYFKTRFSHIVWDKTKNFEYAKQTADCYFLLSENYRKLDKTEPMGHYGIEICYAIGNLQDIVFSLKYKITEFKEYILTIIHNPNKESSCFLKLQLDCIKILLEKVKRGKLPLTVLNGLENLCQTTLENNLDEFFASDYLETGEKISNILKTGPER